MVAGSQNFQTGRVSAVEKHKVSFCKAKQCCWRARPISASIAEVYRDRRSHIVAALVVKSRLGMKIRFVMISRKQGLLFQPALADCGRDDALIIDDLIIESLS